MNARIYWRWPALIGCAMIVTALFFIVGEFEVKATSSSDKVALIAVTNFTTSNTYEIDKVNFLYDFLIDDGWDENDIILLGPSTVVDNDGIANQSNIVSGFENLVDNSNENKEILIYISDNGYPESGIYNFLLTDYNINSTSINSYIDNMTHNELTFIICGNQSGYAGTYLARSEIILVSSMLETQSYCPDEFNITRSLDDPTADTNFDQRISFLEAAEREIDVMDTYTDQTPQIWRN